MYNFQYEYYVHLRFHLKVFEYFSFTSSESEIYSLCKPKGKMYLSRSYWKVLIWVIVSFVHQILKIIGANG